MATVGIAAAGIAAAGAGVNAILEAVRAHKDGKQREHHEAHIKAIGACTEKDEADWIEWREKHPDMPGHIKPPSRPLRLLSLDGGGVRGIISLIVLEQIMKEVSPSRDASLKPCEWFDLQPFA